MAIAEGDGPLWSRLKAILKHEPAGPEGPDHFVRQEPEAIFSTHSSDPKAPTSPSPHVQPPAPAPEKASEQKPAPSTPVEESLSPTRWPVVAVVIAAAFGLLWVLLKKRK